MQNQLNNEIKQNDKIYRIELKKDAEIKTLKKGLNTVQKRNKELVKNNNQLVCDLNQKKQTKYIFVEKKITDKTIEKTYESVRYRFAFHDNKSLYVDFGVYSNYRPGDTICFKCEEDYWSIKFQCLLISKKTTK